LCGSMFVGLWLFANGAERYVGRGLSRNAVFRDRLGDIRSRRATVSSPLRPGALAYLTKKLASVSGHSRCGAVAQLGVVAGRPPAPAGRRWRGAIGLAAHWGQLETVAQVLA